MSERKYKTKEDVLKRAQEAIGLSFKEIDKTNRLLIGKGALGLVVEEGWFDYKANNVAEPDFPEAGVELKVTPYKINKNGEVRAKERLVCNIIDYMEEWKKTFETSSFWHKCANLLIMAYQHQSTKQKSDWTIDKAVLFSYPIEDLVVIRQDWETIIDKIRKGQAHLITEGDTFYLAACTKGSTAKKSRRIQPFDLILAKQRAYSLKSSYMSHVLSEYVFGNKKDERIIKDCRELSNQTFEECLISKVRPYFGKKKSELCELLNVHTTAKNENGLLLARMLNIKGNIAKTAEFQNAQIIPKTIRIQANGRIRESLPFPAFDFVDVANSNWKTSTLREQLEPTKFLFVVFREIDNNDWLFENAFFWNIPALDLEEVESVWKKTASIIRRGVKLITLPNGNVGNNFPKISENPVAHVRPHGRNRNDTLPLPDGREMTKQCFWLNSSYLEQIVAKNLKEERK